MCQHIRSPVLDQFSALTCSYQLILSSNQENSMLSSDFSRYQADKRQSLTTTTYHYTLRGSDSGLHEQQADTVYASM